MFEKTMMAGWSDMDYNAHMRNTAFLDRSADVRMLFFAENGYTAKEFMQFNIGPVVQKDQIEYYREIHLLKTFRVTLMLDGSAEDGSRFRFQNAFYLEDGTPAAIVTSSGGWLDLKIRKLVAPPIGLRRVIDTLTHTPKFEVLSSSLKTSATEAL